MIKYIHYVMYVSDYMVLSDSIEKDDFFHPKATTKARIKGK